MQTRFVGRCARVGALGATLTSSCRTVHSTPVWFKTAQQQKVSSPAAASSTASTTSPASTASSATMASLGNATTIPAGPYRRVGNVFIVHCVDHPFKFSWEVNRMLRELRLEYMGQTSIVPDIPEVRKRLWRVRHIVRVDMLDLDEAKALIGVPEHIHFSDLASQIPATFGRGKSTSSPIIRSKVNFMRLRRMRMRDVLQRDQLEKSLLEEKRKVLAAKAGEASKQAPLA